MSTKTPTSPRELLTLDEASEVLRVSRWSLYQAINRRQLQTVKIGRRRLVHVDDLQQYVRSLRDEDGLS